MIGLEGEELTRWAMVGVRYDQYDPDQDASEEQAANVVPVDRTYRTLALMAMARLRRCSLVIVTSLCLAALMITKTLLRHSVVNPS